MSPTPLRQEFWERHWICKGGEGCEEGRRREEGGRVSRWFIKFIWSFQLISVSISRSSVQQWNVVGYKQTVSSYKHLSVKSIMSNKYDSAVTLVFFISYKKRTLMLNWQGPGAAVWIRSFQPSCNVSSSLLTHPNFNLRGNRSETRWVILEGKQQTAYFL